MQRSPQGYLFSAQDLIQFATSDFACWMERFALDHPSIQLADDPDDLFEALIQLGRDHEKSFLNQLIHQQTDLVLIENRGAFKATKLAMKSGHDYIYQGALTHNKLLGYPDFLVKVNAPSQLGSWSYIPLECKLAMTPKADFVIQASCYCALLENIQGLRPKEFRLLLGNQTQQSFNTENTIYFFHYLWQLFQDRMEGFAPENPPEILPGDHGRWSKIAQAQLMERDHLCQVANITRTQIRKLENSGITTLKALANTEKHTIPKLDSSLFQRLRGQAQLQQTTKETQSITFQVIKPDHDTHPKGLALLPPSSSMDIYFDVEGYPLVTGGLEYLFGAVYLEGNEPVFKDWWAEDTASEKLAFEAFIDWVFERWSVDPSLHVYHYAPYETIAIKRLMGRYSTREAEVDQLLRHQVFVDLYQIVRQGLLVGTQSYSIKDLEPLYGRQRQESVKKAVDSVTQYFQWLQIKDNEPEAARRILQDIRDYNEVDCLSTLELTTWLRSLQTQHGITYRASQAENPEQRLTDLVLSPEAKLAQSLLSEPPTDSHQTLLGQLLEFYDRESKPFWWQRFEWLGMDTTALMDQADCIAGLQRTATPPTPPEGRSRSWLYEYQFPTGQDIRISAPSSCWFVPEATVKSCALKFLDLEKGLATIGVSVASIKKVLDSEDWLPPRQMSLIDMSQVSTQGLASAVFETVQEWSETQKLQPALEDLFKRRSPRFQTSDNLESFTKNTSLLKGAIAAVHDLDDSLLCIQGPPGTGKTYTAAQIILSLLEQGKTIAISANSHAAIANLMMKVAEFSHEKSFKLLKVGGSANPSFETLGITWKKSDRGLSYEEYQLTGATAFQLCKPGAMNQWDYLFVDEAGQMSLANLVAIARCAKNIVLMGDQMQLEQPIQATHPGESGQSALGFYLNDQATIPSTMGIFLNTTYRMHPEICDFISTSVYEGRLTHHPDTSHHQIKIPHGHRWITQGNGIQFIPVIHDDNSQSSREEVEMIETLVDSLLGLDFVSDRGETTGQITPNDILVVAPYNLQVKQLQSALGDSQGPARNHRARIGTVDKFQGQEAPIVIVSMTASSAETAPRGLDFLLNLNRINVALSRAQCLSLVVGSPGLAMIQNNSLKEIEQINLLCKLMACNSSNLECR